MAKTESRISFVQSTDTEFRTWVAAVITDLLAVGMVQSGDTGQINTATVLTPSAANQVRGFWMGTLNDGLTTLYIKVEFGSGSQGALNPAIYFTLGWATDGAGTFVGNTTSRFRYRLTNGNNGVTAYIRMCKVGSCFVTAFNEASEGTSPHPWANVIDRYRTAVTGAPNASGATMIGMANTEVNSSGGGAVFCSTIAFPSSTTQQEFAGVGLIGPFLWSSTATWSRGSRLGVGSLCSWDAGANQPVIGCVAITNTDVPLSTTFSASIYGTSYVYRATSMSTIRNTGNVGQFAYLYQ